MRFCVCNSHGHFAWHWNACRLFCLVVCSFVCLSRLPFNLLLSSVFDCCVDFVCVVIQKKKKKKCEYSWRINIDYLFLRFAIFDTRVLFC